MLTVTNESERYIHRRTGSRIIRAGSVWKHTPGVCSAVGTVPTNVISHFRSLLRANLGTPIKELCEQLQYGASHHQVTRARQKIIREDVLNNPKYYRLLPLYFQSLREAHPHSMFDIEFDHETGYSCINRNRTSKNMH